MDTPYYERIIGYMSNISETKSKLRVGILFGGKSAEHEVSIQSARNVLAALDKIKFEPILIGIDRDGKWKRQDVTAFLSEGVDTCTETLKYSTDELRLALDGKDGLIVVSGETPLQPLNIIFSLLHGPLGEDGAVQGLLEVTNTPYVGAGILGSAVGMDKDVMKRLLREAGAHITEHVVLRSSDQKTFDPKAIIKTLGLPLFVKPANMGSSVGVSKVENAAELLRAIELGFQYDRKVLIEKAVSGDEVECAVLGNEEPKASEPGRVSFQAGFYTYDAKYDEDEGSMLEIPAKLPLELRQKIQATAIKAYKTLECEGMARVDMFVTPQNEVLVNEINTLPGFTKLSMYPQLWGASGLSYTDLITKLLELALKRASRRRKLLTIRNISNTGGGIKGHA